MSQRSRWWWVGTALALVLLFHCAGAAEAGVGTLTGAVRFARASPGPAGGHTPLPSSVASRVWKRVPLDAATASPTPFPVLSNATVTATPNATMSPWFNVSSSTSPTPTATKTRTPSKTPSSTRTPSPTASPPSAVVTIYVGMAGNATCSPCGTSQCPCHSLQAGLDAVNVLETRPTVVLVGPGSYEGAGNHNVSFPADCKGEVELRSLVTYPSSSVASILCNSTFESGLRVPANTAGGSYRITSLKVDVCGTAARVRNHGLLVEDGAVVNVDGFEMSGKLLVESNASATISNSVLLGTSPLAYTLSPIQVGEGSHLNLHNCSISEVELSSDFLEYLKSPVALIEASDGGAVVNMTQCTLSNIESGGKGFLDRTVVGTYVSHGFLDMAGCTLANNTGGATIMVVNSTALVQDSSITGHTRSTAIMSERSSFSMTGGFVDAGEALLSPSVFVFGEANNPVVFTEVAFTRNRNALGDGGALHFQSGNVTLIACTFDDVNYARRGGSIFFGASPLHVLLERYSEPQVELHGELLERLLQAATQEEVLAAIESSRDTYSLEEGSEGVLDTLAELFEMPAAVTAGWLQITNSTFISSSARSSGGAIHAFGDISVDIQGCNFQDNAIAQGHGGAVNVHTSSSTVTTIFNSSFSGNGALRGDGGAVNSAGWLVIDTCTFDNNTAENGAAVSASGGNTQLKFSDFTSNAAVTMGGGIMLSADVSASIYNTDFYYNEAGASGGGLGITGNATVEAANCTFASNMASSSGAAIHTDEFASGSFTDVVLINSTTLGSAALVCTGHSFPTFVNVLVTYNSASQEGGGVMVLQEAEPQFQSCIISFNECSTSGGGFVAAGSATPQLSNCTIEHNSGSSGGGVLCLGSSSPTLTDTIIRNNFAFGDGGGIATQDESTLSFSGGTLEGNKALSAGGGISVHGDSAPNIFGTVIFNNTALSHGGGVSFHDRSAAALDECTISGNMSPVNGGGIVCLDLSNATITHTSIDLNSAGSQGGGVLVATFSQPTITHCQVTQNSANSKGGGIQLVNNCTPVIEHCNISHNTATNGGGIALNDNSQPYFYNVTVQHNVAVSEAGGLLLEDNSGGSLSMSDVSFNNVTAGSAGGILAGAFSNMTITDTTISGNNAASGGGLLISSSSAVDLERCLVLSNKARTDGGGAYLIEETTATLTSCIIDGNEAGNNGAGLAVSDVASPFLFNVTATNNVARLKGGGVYFEGGSGTVMSQSDISANSALTGGGIFAEEQAQYSISFTTVETNNARSGGGIYCMCSPSTLADVIIRNNTATYGGGIIALPCLLASHALHLERLDIISNSAFQGGGVFVESIENPPPMVLPAEVKYTFENCTIEANYANIGGGIFHAATEEVLLSFGPKCLLSGNTAETYGGAVFLSGSEVPSNKTVLLYNAVFTGNAAYFAGSTIAFEAVPDDQSTVDVSVFCQNCTFEEDNVSGWNGTTGYQTREGFATAPVAIELVSACPGTTQLVSNDFSVTVDLWDGFGTAVQGPLLDDGSWEIGAAVQYNEQAPCGIGNNDSLSVPTSGELTFLDLTLEGTNNNACQVTFYATSAPDPLAPVSCSIMLSGCPSGGTVAASEQAPFDTCIQESQLLSTGEIVAISIASVVFCVCLLLLLLVVAVYFRKRKEPEYHNYGKLPDFHEKQLTLEEVLNDPNIPHIAWNTIERGKRIGIGGSGIVWQATMSEGDSSRMVALKQLLFGLDNIQEDILQEFLREIRIMNALKHENVVEFLGVAISDQRELYLVTELMGNGSLFDLLTKKQQNMPWHLRLKLLKDAATGMAYLHQRSLIHRDLKSQNLLVSDQWVCKIADFGISTIKPEASRAMTCIGTPMYMAPEVITKNKYSEKADIFSFGILLVETYTCRPPYSEPKFARINQAQIANEGLRPSIEELPPGLEQLVQDCWNEEPTLRPAFTEIVVRLERLRTQSLDDERLEKKSLSSPRTPNRERRKRKPSKPAVDDATAYVSFDSHEIQQLINSEDFGPISSSAALGSIQPNHARKQGAKPPAKRSTTGPLRSSDPSINRKRKSRAQTKSPSAEPLLSDGGGSETL